MKVVLDKARAQAELRKLVKRYEMHFSEYESSDYLERQLQNDFLNEMFTILGWDLQNKANLSSRQREVLVEKGDTKGRPDYAFRINGLDKFFVEAKSPNRGTEKPEDIFQAKKYGYNTKTVTIAILTDFKTLKVFDTSIKPNFKQPNQALLFETNLNKMAESDFDQIYVFQRDEVHNGSIEQLLQKYPALKRLRVPVDITFLEQLTGWRETLAKDIFKNNPDLTVRSLNDVVQRLLDRLIFIRLIEDREITKNKQLKDISDNWKASKHRDIQPELNALFKKLNKDFNGEIFKPHDCEKILYYSKIVSDIIDELYPPESPYDFSIMPVEILGIIYEKYLGKTIRLTEKRLKVEEKPEVRKAGGVFYTPKWVVDHIVGNTVGEIIEGKTPEQISKLHFLDPACGSGSFLIGALNKIFDYHLDYYIQHRREAHEGTLFPKVIRIQNMEPRLSIYAKADILKNNIYGVDLDPQAVEITMMSLYIKVLEGERALPENKELLPSLSNNIRNGNSLIGFDYVSQQTLDDSEKEKTNPFEWRSEKTGFGKIIGDKGGFHAIIGNPPYIRIQTMREWASKEVDYITNKYKTAENANYDIYVVFVEKAIELLDPNGLFGYILPHKFFQAEYGENLRRIISENKLLREIISFKDQQVFDEATTYTCLLFLSKMKRKEFKYTEISKLEDPVSQLSIIKKESKYTNGTMQVGSIPLDSLSEKPWQFSLGKEANLMERLKQEKIKLGNVSSRIFQGLVTGADPVFILMGNEKIEGKYLKLFSKAMNKEIKVEAEILKPLLKGQEIKRYSTPIWKYWIIFPYNIENSKAILISKEEMESKYPNIWAYLNENKKKLLERDRGKLKVEWYAFGRTQNINQFYEPKIMTQVLANRASFTLDKKGVYYFVGGGNAGGYGVKLNDRYNLDLRYILALLNSKLLDFYLQKISTTFRGGFYSYARRFIEQLPIHIPNKSEEKEYNELVSLVDKILELNQKKNKASNEEFIEREISVYEEKIDEIVYRIYGITEDEKKL